MRIGAIQKVMYLSLIFGGAGPIVLKGAAIASMVSNYACFLHTTIPILLVIYFLVWLFYTM